MVYFSPFLVPVILLGAYGPSAVGPATVVQALFSDHFKHERGFTKASVARKAKWLSTDFLNLLNVELDRRANPNEAPTIDGDPFTDSQEYPKRFVVGKAEIRGDVTRIPVIFTGNGHRRTIAVRLLETTDGWRVDDLFYEDGKTLRSRLGK